MFVNNAADNRGYLILLPMLYLMLLVFAVGPESNGKFSLPIINGGGGMEHMEMGFTACTV